MKTLKEWAAESSLVYNDTELNPFYQYAPVDAMCENCGHQLYLNTTIILTTYPAQFQYYCPKCGHVESSFIKLPRSDRYD